MQQFSIKEVFTHAWDTFWKRPWFMIAVFVGVFLVSMISGSIFTPHNQSGVVGVMGGIIDFLISTFMGLGVVTLSLKADRAIETVKSTDLLNPGRFLSYLVATIAVAIVTVVGLILLIVPGLIAISALIFTPYLVVDRGMSPFDAMKESMRMTKGTRVRILMFIGVAVLANIVGVLALGVGVLISAPVSVLAFVHLYRLYQAPVPQVSEAVTA